MPIPLLDARSSDRASKSRVIVILFRLFRHSAPSTHNIFSLEAAIDQAGLSDYIIVEVFLFFFFLPFIMSTFEDELRRQGLLEDLAALPALAVSGRVPSTTGGCRMILAFLVVLEGIPEGFQVRKRRLIRCISLRLPKPKGFLFVFIVSEKDPLLALR